MLEQPNAVVSHPKISPDGRHVVATIGQDADADIWIFDLGRGTDRRLTFEAGPDTYPSWTPDGRYVVYACGTTLCARGADGGGACVELLDEIMPVSTPVVSPDGRHLVFVRETRPGDADLWIVDLPPDGPTSRLAATPRPLLRADRMQRNAAISPDGRFVAYVSAESGPFAVYVSRFPGGDGKWEVSRGFGAWPRWGAKGDRLYFLDDLYRIAEMEVDLRESFVAGPILTRVPAQVSSGLGIDPSADGRQFLVPYSPRDQGRQARLLLVQNWMGRRAER